MNNGDLKDRLAREAQITLGVISLVVFVASAVAQTPVPHPLLGYGWGVDHVGVGVRDHSNAQRDYERLGFTISEDGDVNLENKTYLELLSVKEPQSNAGSQDIDARIADFVKKHEGAIFLGLNVSSAKVAASYLKAQNFDVEGNFDVEPPPPFYFVRTAFKPAPNKLGFSVPIFLVEYHSSNWYDKARKEGWMEHPNTAIGIHAVWFAVHDLKPQLRILRDAGFKNDESCDVQLLGARGCELKAGSGRMILLESSNKSSVLQKYLSDHDEGIIAISVEVSDLSKARRLAESVVGGKIGIYKGTYGQSLLLSPAVTHGVWLEMFQK